jgi:hypothetical protein
MTGGGGENARPRLVGAVGAYMLATMPLAGTRPIPLCETLARPQCGARRRRLARALIGVLASACCAAHAAPKETAPPPRASVNRAAKPMPPRRPAPPHEQREHPAPPAAPAPLADLPPPDPSAPPPSLPRASRAQMHECAVEWQKRKLAPNAAALLWRDFAAKCLTR